MDFAGFSQSAKVLTLKHLHRFFPQNDYYYYVALCKHFHLQIMSLSKYFKRESILICLNPMARCLNQSLPTVLQLQIKQWRVFCLEDLCWMEDAKLETQQPDCTRGSHE